jgi:hypothetical protein
MAMGSVIFILTRENFTQEQQRANLASHFRAPKPTAARFPRAPKLIMLRIIR